jgi:glycosyltransferase involved in cell wall biosynthesis
MLDWTSRQANLRVEIVNTSPGRLPGRSPRIWRRMVEGIGQAPRVLGSVAARLVRRRPDVVHLATSGGLSVVRDVCILLLARLWRIRTVYHLHFGRLPALARRGGVERAALSLPLRLSTIVVVLDDASAAAAAAIAPGARVARMPHFIDASRWSAGSYEPAAARRLQILFVGWINEAKGLCELVTAGAGLASRHDLEIVLAGTGDPAFEARLRALAGQPAPWLRMIGEVAHEDIPSLMAGADIVVLPSHYEGFPYAVLEAMSMSRAIVATRVGAVPAMLELDGEPAGLLVAPRDAPALEGAIERLIEDAALRAELGRRARQAVERRFTLETVRGAWLALWAGSRAA